MQEKKKHIFVRIKEFLKYSLDNLKKKITFITALFAVFAIDTLNAFECAHKCVEGSSLSQLASGALK